MVFRYKDLLKSMKQETFEYCRQYLWTLCDYRVLKKEDVRKIDLEDQLVRIQEQYPVAFGTKNPDYMVYYLDSLRFCFERYLKCSKGSRQEVYYNRAIGIMEQIKKDHETEGKQWDSLIMIFVSLVRWKSEKGTQNIEFTVKKEDADLLNIYRVDERYGLRNRNALHREKNYVFAITILLLAIVLQKTGEIIEEA